MFKKSDILPLSLAFVSTVLIVTMGFSWLLKHNIAGLGKSNLGNSRIPQISGAEAKLVPSESRETNNTQANFVVPVIVPQGTSVAINGSGKFAQINQALRRSFHQEYPGTMITTEADGSDVALDLLYSGDIDILALDRSLKPTEEAAGLVAIPLNKFGVENNETNSTMYYVYKDPLNPDIEAFLGYALSVKGQQAISDR